MADNSTIGSTDSIRDIDRLASGVKTQVAQVDFGGGNANAEQLATRINPFPVGNTMIATGTITAPDVLGGTPDGFGTPIVNAATASSYVSLQVPYGAGSWTGLIGGYAGGVVYTESSVDSTNGINGSWVPVKGRKTGTPPGVEIATFAQVANGEYRGNCAAILWIRARLVGGAGPVSITLVASTAVGAGFTNSGLMASGSVIGIVGIDPTRNTIALPVTNDASGSLPEQMTMMVAAQLATVNLLAQLVALSRGREVTSAEEGDAMVAEYLNKSNSFPLIN